MKISVRWRPILAALIASTLTAFGVVLVDDDGDGHPDRIIVPIPRTVHAAPPATAIDGPDKDTKRDDALPLNEDAQGVLEDVAALPEKHASELTEPLRDVDDNGPAGVLDGPLAAQEFDGCRTRFVRNYSSRRGQTPRVIVWHYTVSTPRPGWADNDGLTAYANSPRSGVSWHFLIGRDDGHCTFSVPLHMKAWTQGNANPFSLGIEVIARGNEPAYVTGAGERRLLDVTRRLGKRYDIPMRRGVVRDCRVVRPGVVAHADLGACGGGHHDIAPFAIDPFIAKLKTRAITGTDRVTCRKLNWWRRAGRPKGAPENNAVRRRRALDARGVTCTAGGPALR